MLLAAETFIGQLRDGDRLSLVAFSDGVYLGIPPLVIDPNSRNFAIASVRSLVDGGGTNFSGGLLAGLAQVFSAFQPWQINQVILFSDGQPNIGITSTDELTRIAGRAAEHGVAVTTIGFGMAHDELLMQGIADASGGNYYYVDSPGDMGRIFQQEAGAILRSAARGTDIDLPLPPGLELEEVIGYDYVVMGGRIYVRLGSVPHGEERYVVFRFRGGTGGQVPLGVVYADSRPPRAVRGRLRPELRRPGRRPRQLGPRARGPGRGRFRSAGVHGLGRLWERGVRDLRSSATRAGSSPAMRERLGPQALTAEDNMLLQAQADLGLKVASGAANSFLSGGVGGLLNFGKQQAVSNATTAVVYNVDKAFHARIRIGVQTTFQGGSGTRYAVRGTPYKPHDHDASIRFKRARWKSYQMMRTR